MKRITSLDGLRAFSIGLVFLGHLLDTVGYPENSLTRFSGSFAYSGVRIFFVISGFLITSLLLQEREKTGHIDLKSFYLRRTFRIFPAAFAYIAFAVVLQVLIHDPIQPKYLALAVTYTSCYSFGGPQVLGHLWSLSVEEQFYLLWPVALVGFFGIRKRTCWAVMILSPLARLIYARHSPELVNGAFPAVADSLAAGCLLALYRPELKRLPTWVYGTPFTLVVTAAALASKLLNNFTPLIWGIIPLLIALAIHILVERKDWILNNPLVIYIGTLSYSLYLFQQPFLKHAPSPHAWAHFPLNVVLSIFAGIVCHYLVEQPVLRWGKVFIAGRSKKPSQASYLHRDDVQAET